jgi:hypothetical protein
MKYSPQYFRPLGVGEVGFTCIRQDDYVLGIEWWTESDVKVYAVFSGFAKIRAEDVRAVRQARKSIDTLETRHDGLSRLLWLKRQIYSVIDQIKSQPPTTSYWRFMIKSADTQRQRVYNRLCRDAHWQIINGDLFWID